MGSKNLSDGSINNYNDKNKQEISFPSLDEALDIKLDLNAVTNI